jgi:hypothetical protein
MLFAGESRLISALSVDRKADFLRRTLVKKDVDKGCRSTLAAALKAARSKKANYLPGW